MCAHYPGYNYLGPGTDPKRRKLPVNDLDAAAQRHDIGYAEIGPSSYYTYNQYDENFLNAISGDQSLPGRISKLAFKTKKVLAPRSAELRARARAFYNKKRMPYVSSRRRRRVLPGRRIANRRFRRGIPLRTRTPRMVIRKRRTFSRSRSRFRPRRKTLFQKVISIIRPTRLYSKLSYGRVAGIANRRTFLDLGYHTGIGPAVEKNLFCDPPFLVAAVTNALPTAYSSAQDYYIHSAHRTIRLSNNSNVAIDLNYRIYKNIRDKSSRITPLEVVNSFDSTDWLLNNGTLDGIVATSTYNLSTYRNFNLLALPFIRRRLSMFFKIYKKHTVHMKPGETVTFKLAHRKPRIWNNDHMTEVAGSTGSLAGWTKGIIIDWTGDVLPSTAGATVSGTNAGDLAWELSDVVRVSEREDEHSTMYATLDSNGVSGTGLTTFGPDNNAAVAAV